MADITKSESPVVTSPEVLDEEAKKPVTNSLLDVLGGRKTEPTIVTPRQPKRTTLSKPQYISPEEERERKLKIKQQKAEEYEKFITETVNDYIITILVGAGVPENLLYKPGKAPKRQVVDSAYTDLANSLIFKETQAKALAAFLAELANTDNGKGITQSYTEGTLGLVVKGIGAVLAGGTYLVGVNRTMKQLAPFLAAMKKGQVVRPDESEDETNG